MASDAELIAAWRSGDTRAGSTLFDRHAADIYRFLRAKVGDTAAEDLVQETFLACLSAADGFRGDASFRTYLFHAARSRLYNWLERDRVKAARIDFTVATLEDLAPSPSVAVAVRERDRALLEALRRIPLEHQIALELHYFEQIRGLELAEVLGVPDGTARTRLRRARALLAEQLRDVAAGAALVDTDTDLEAWAAEIRAQRG